MITGDFNIYTVANDRMLPFLKSFCNSLKCQDKSILNNLYVIPFNDEIVETTKYCDDNDINLVSPEPVWDYIGDVIYSDEEYRPGVKAKNYFRKLNCFSHSDKKFVFFDVNSIILDDFTVAFRQLERSSKSILFMTRSAKGRTLRHESLSSLFGQINKNIKTGFNAGFFVSYPKVIDRSMSLNITNKNLRRVFGKAPEQGFISYYLGIYKIDCGLLSETGKNFQSGFWPDKFKVINKNDGFYYDNENLLDRRLFVIKWTGQDQEGTKKTLNYDIYKKFSG